MTTPINEINHKQMVTNLAKPADDIVAHLSKHPQQAHAIHMAIGVAGEAGELLDAIKKHVIYGKEADIENAIEELGDLEFYMEGLRQHFDITREQTLEANMKKLLKGKNARYASGSYSDSQAQARADKTVVSTEATNFIVEMINNNEIFNLHDGSFAFSSTDLNEYCYYVGGISGEFKSSASITNKALFNKVKPVGFQEEL